MTDPAPPFYHQPVFQITMGAAVLGAAGVYFYKKTNALSQQLADMTGKFEQIERLLADQKKMFEEKMKEIRETRETVAFLSNRLAMVTAPSPVHHPAPAPSPAPARVRPAAERVATPPVRTDMTQGGHGMPAIQGIPGGQGIQGMTGIQGMSGMTGMSDSGFFGMFPPTMVVISESGRPMHPMHPMHPPAPQTATVEDTDSLDAELVDELRELDA